MITRLTKIQLMIFAIVTLVGGAFVGGRYAKVDRLVVDRTYQVTTQLPDSGGLFEGAQVTYRGLGVGRVGKMTFTEKGVEARIDIENSAPKIPADILAVVANKSAVGEQFMDLQPRSTDAPYLKDGANITEANTRIPIQTSKLLLNVNNLVSSIDTNSLKTVVDELGTAFQGAGEDLGTIIDTTTSFIETANDNIDVTRSLIQDSNTVLQTQVDKGSEIRTFSKNLALLSDTLVSADPDLRRLLDGGAPAAKEIRQVIQENEKDLNVLINNLITVNRPLYENTQAVRALFILFPYLLEGAPSTLIQNPETKEYNAAFGMVMGAPGVNDTPHVCHKGYDDDRRAPQDVVNNSPDDLFNIKADCTDPDPTLVPRNPSKAVVEKNRSAAAGYDSSLTSTATGASGSTGLVVDPFTFGKDSWKWLFVGPAASR